MKKTLVIIMLLSSFLSIVKAESNAAFYELLAKYHQKSGFSGAVLVLKNGKPILAKAVGYADESTLQPVSLLTPFDIGSIQKNLTAVMVLQAYDKGLLQLNDTLDKFSLGFTDPQIQDITIQHLLEHRSGFADIFTAEYRNNPAKYFNIAEKLSILQSKPLLFKPGSDRQYSNFGYIVLGAILEKVTKQDYWDLLEKNVLQPSRLVLRPEQFSVGENTVATPYHLSYEGKRVPVPTQMREYKSPDGGG